MEAFDLVSKCRFINDKLPLFLQSRPNPDQRAALGLPEMGSEIIALPSTEKAGRSTDATVVVCDEWEFHPYAENNFAALRPTLGSGGQFIALSTADKTKMNSFFKQKYLEAKDGNSTLKPIFLPWHLRPGRDVEWFERETKDLRPWQIEQEYPTTEKDALSTLRSIPFFSQAALDAMKSDLCSPLEHELSTKYRGMVNIYKLPVVGKRYVLYTDPSDGKTDPHAAVVMDSQTGEEVASSHGMTGADTCAVIHDSLCRMYFNAFNTYDANARAGGIFFEKMKALETPNQAWRLTPEGKLDQTRTGWWIGARLKDTVLYGLEEAVRLRQVVIHRKNGLEEMEWFMKPEGEDPQAPVGGHDDWIMAWSGVWQLRKYLPAEMGGVKSYHYKRR